MPTADRRHIVRREDDRHGLTKDQLDQLIKKVEDNHDASIRNESVTVRLSAVEAQVKRLCSRITNGLWAMVGSLIVAVGTLIAAVWHIVVWIQKLIEHTIIIA